MKWGTQGTGEGELDNPWGIAINKTGHVYVTDMLNHRIQVFNTSGHFIREWGSEGTGEGQFNRPYGIAINNSGYVYVTEFYNERIQVFDPYGNHLFNWSTGLVSYPRGIALNSSSCVYVATQNSIKVYDPCGTFITEWGSMGTGNGEFDTPEGVAINRSGYVYVTDFFNNRIQVFDYLGNFIRKWGTDGTSEGEFHMPSGITTNASGYIYVADGGNARVQVFDSWGNYLTKWGSTGSTDGRFGNVNGIALNSTGQIFAIDGGNDRVQVFETAMSSTRYDYLYEWGGTGTGEGQFSSPNDIALNRTGHIYCVDMANYRIQVFDSVGNFLFAWGSEGTGNGQFKIVQGIAINNSGYVYITDILARRVQVFDPFGNYILEWGTEGSDPGEFLSPWGIAINNSGFVYVTDFSNNRVEVFDQCGNFQFEWGDSGSADGEFQSICGIAINSSGEIYAADLGNNRIQVFDQCGNFLFNWGTTGTTNGQFDSPTGIALNQTSHVYITDTVNHRIQVFNASGGFITKWGTEGSDTGQFNGVMGICVNDSGSIFTMESDSNNRIQVFGVDCVPPEINAVTGAQDPLGEHLDQTLECSISDPGSGLAGALVYFRVNGGPWNHDNQASFLGNLVTIGAANYSHNDLVEYYVVAWDNLGNYNYRCESGIVTSEEMARLGAFSFTAVDEISPSISTASVYEEVIPEHLNQIIYSSFSDTGGSFLDWMVVYYKLNANPWDHSNNISFVDGEATISASLYTHADTIYYYIAAKDNAGNILFRNNNSDTTPLESIARIQTFSFSTIDGISPTFGPVDNPQDPIPDYSNQGLSWTITDTGGSGLSWSRVFFRVGSQVWDPTQYATLIGNSATIQASNYSANQTTYYYLAAKDGVGNINYWTSTGVASNEGFARQNPLSFMARSDEIIITKPADFSYTVGSTGNQITWILQDWFTGDTSFSVFISDELLASYDSISWIAGEENVINVDGLPEGVHNITIVAADGRGFTVSDTVVVTVFGQQVTVIVISAIVGGVAITVSVGVTLRVIRARRKRFTEKLAQEFEAWEDSQEKKT